MFTLTLNAQLLFLVKFLILAKVLVWLSYHCTVLEK